MNRPSANDTITLPVRSRPHGGRDDGAAGGVSPTLQDARQALDRARAMRDGVDRVLGGLELDDTQNCGGQ